ncbi:MAG TPA: hypothetical protein VHZ76_05920 [Gammaproteobacteria bacterium]|jgi:hypothetical protein|nr:hypothetical protein [Gammaproteobacteria bacterium]
MHEFPEIFSIASLIFKNRNYAQVVAPLLFGDRIAGRIFSKSSYRDLITWSKEEKINYSGIDDKQLFASWIKESVRKQPLPSTERETNVLNHDRQQTGWNKVKLFVEKVNQVKKISIIMQYDMDKTSTAYVDHTIKEKMCLLSSVFTEYQIQHIQLEFLIVDARQNRQSGIEHYIDQALQESGNQQVTGRQIQLTTGVYGKANAVKYGMDNAVAKGADIVGFIDFSNKIPVLDLCHLFADVLEQQALNKPSAAIGSRRLIHSEVVNKPLTFLLRSTGLNLTVKSLFPELFQISDTQTGFKVFSADAWQKVSPYLKCKSLAFDVEILSLLSKFAVNIKEEPVTFNDNNLDSTELAGVAGEMLPDLLRIRARTQNIGKVKATTTSPIRIAAGAEHTVYDLGDDSLLKIPTQFADPDFIIILKNLIFNKVQAAFPDHSA